MRDAPIAAATGCILALTDSIKTHASSRSSSGSVRRFSSLGCCHLPDLFRGFFCDLQTNHSSHLALVNLYFGNSKHSAFSNLAL